MGLRFRGQCSVSENPTAPLHGHEPSSPLTCVLGLSLPLFSLSPDRRLLSVCKHKTQKGYLKTKEKGLLICFGVSFSWPTFGPKKFIYNAP